MLLRDLRLAWRRLRAAPAFALFSIATLAVTIGVTTAAYSLVYHLWPSSALSSCGAS